MFRFTKPFKFIFTCFIFSTLYFYSIGTAFSVEPIPPFSKEGNPPDDYHFESFFPLFRYISPPKLKVFENEDFSRSYEPEDVCNSPNADSRDYECAYQGTQLIDGCDGGEVKMCFADGSFSRIKKSSPTRNCDVDVKKEDRQSGVTYTGTCNYTQKPRLSRKITGTDFSNPDNLTYPKYQSKSLSLINQSSSDNLITNGALILGNKQCDLVVKRLITLSRAKQTKDTVDSTGEWPLGWVDWGYTTYDKEGNNEKTLLKIYKKLPPYIKTQANIIVEGTDDFYLNAGNLDAVSDISKAKKKACNQYQADLTKEKTWTLDLAQVPLYGPSFRQGFVRGSICIKNICCKTDRCNYSFSGNTKSLYHDTDSAQALAASLDNLFITYQLKEGIKIFKQLVFDNPLLRFATSASTQAIPSVITTRLNKELASSKCLSLLPSGSDYNLKWLGTIYDYLNEHKFFDKQKKCPGYALQSSSFIKEEAGAVPQSPLSNFVSLLFNPMDDILPITRHLITIPEILSQSLSEIQTPVNDTQDTLRNIERAKKYSQNLSNIISDNLDNLLIGQSSTVAHAKRRLAYFTCNDKEYSVPSQSSILNYSLGIRISCNNEDALVTNKCDPTLFKKMTTDSPWKAPLPEAEQAVLNSKMFVDGKLNPKLEEVYAQVAKKTGVPCEVLAGIHFEEGTIYFTSQQNLEPEQISLTDGTPLKEGESLLQNAFITANEMQGRFQAYHPMNTQALITTISNYNGSGNGNCQPDYLYNIPYNGCPKLFVGEDDPYATNMLDSRHTNMWLLFNGEDGVPGKPSKYDSGRPGAFAVALTVYNHATKKDR